MAQAASGDKNRAALAPRPSSSRGALEALRLFCSYVALFRKGFEMTVSNGDILRASARFQDAQGNDVVNVYNFRCDFAADQTDQDVFDEVDAYLTSVYTEYDAIIDADFDPYDLKVDVVTFAGGEWVVTQNVGFGAWGTGITSTAIGDALPPGAAVLVKLGTGLGKHTGRKFLGGFVDVILDTNGDVDPATVTGISTGFAKLLVASVISAGNEIATVILDQKLGTVRDVVEAVVGSLFSYQRRRRPGVGS